jgi:hypothetical protein
MDIVWATDRKRPDKTGGNFLSIFHEAATISQQTYVSYTAIKMKS